ncbi:aminopeptidase [Deinococcus cellulosilyticus]|uniref:Aminopeptidase n=1 Tax=Deinococcus cellulosilyticus (strain DSM 18568 / NBRC 106333 / KACC 11606 / 5516J-15) TaxID=1223518 RepID=A0A511N8P4_DEIC1|nr:aminopeptidase [Deinococcus cellulosilyticus]GEM49204.1 aminopeptidase [Deinococcus cellulosilyticus NBRC 106333 = KACC 11606]
MLTFEQKLRNYAEIAVKIGIGLKEGQRLLVLSPVETAPLARLVVEEAYKAGARLVDVLWSDDAVQLARFQHSRIDNFDEVSNLNLSVQMEYASKGDPVLSIRATDPNLLKGQDPEKVSKYNLAFSKSRKPYLELVQVNAFSWTLISAPIPSWAASVFPDVPAEEQQDKLWDAIFAATRADLENGLQAWQEHIVALDHRAKTLNGKNYSALHFKSTATDLTVGLPEGHFWESAQNPNRAGDPFCANIPTEEVFTLPHREKVDGVVRSTKPLTYMGQLMDGFEITFKDGQVVDFKAEQGEDALRKLLATDEGATRLGEVALVPTSSPINRSGIFFYNTLYDENAVCHIALGSAYRHNMHGGVDLSTEEFKARGGNESLIHVDFMIGSDDMDVDGLLPDGTREPVMRQGEFVI